MIFWRIGLCVGVIAICHTLYMLVRVTLYHAGNIDGALGMGQALGMATWLYAIAIVFLWIGFRIRLRQKRQSNSE